VRLRAIVLDAGQLNAAMESTVLEHLDRDLATDPVGDQLRDILADAGYLGCGKLREKARDAE